MSGARLVLDTNAIVDLLNGTSNLSSVLDHATWIGISVISYLEFMGFSKLTMADEKLFADFCGRVEIVGLTLADTTLLEMTTRLRRKYLLKLPDAIIAATALTTKAMLITSDDDFRKVADLCILNPH